MTVRCASESGCGVFKLSPIGGRKRISGEIDGGQPLSRFARRRGGAATAKVEAEVEVEAEAAAVAMAISVASARMTEAATAATERGEKR